MPQSFFFVERKMSVFEKAYPKSRSSFEPVEDLVQLSIQCPKNKKTSLDEIYKLPQVARESLRRSEHEYVQPRPPSIMCPKIEEGIYMEPGGNWSLHFP